MVMDRVLATSNPLLPASYDVLWTLVMLLALVVVPVVIAVVSYGVARLAVRHELARQARQGVQQAV
jgi:hypothetical protein